MPRRGLPSTEGNGLLRTAVLNNWSLADREEQRVPPPASRERRRSSSLIEALIVSLFLLSLVLGVRMVHVQKQAQDAQGAYEALQASIPTLKPFLDSLPTDHQPRADEVQEFVLKLARVVELEKARAGLARENADLRSRLAAKSPPPKPQEAPAANAALVEGEREHHRGDKVNVIVEGSVPPSEAMAARAETALVERAREPLHDWAGKVSAIVENDLSPNEATAPPAENLNGVVASPRRTQRRPGCGSGALLQAHAGRQGGRISAWCP